MRSIGCYSLFVSVSCVMYFYTFHIFPNIVKQHRIRVHKYDLTPQIHHLHFKVRILVYNPPPQFCIVAAVLFVRLEC